MEYSNAVEAVDAVFQAVCSEFQVHAAHFYTENDIVCYFYSLLQQILPTQTATDKDGHEHFLVHREYPTPFRCDMRKNRFKVMDEDATTEKGGRFQRGHYDIVVLNPDFIRRHCFEVIKAQDYELYKRRVVPRFDEQNPVILYGLEFMYSRDPLKLSRGESVEKGIDGFIEKVKQDADKLLASRDRIGFMDQVKMLVFVKGSSEEIRSLLERRLSGRDEITLSFAK